MPGKRVGIPASGRIGTTPAKRPRRRRSSTFGFCGPGASSSPRGPGPRRRSSCAAWPRAKLVAGDTTESLVFNPTPHRSTAATA